MAIGRFVVVIVVSCRPTLPLDRRRLLRGLHALSLSLIGLGAAPVANAETGYDLWLRYLPVQDAARRDAYRHAPMPENTDPRRADWSATYYHRADASGIGYDRKRAGSAAVDQYRSPLREEWADPSKVPETLLLWFHRRPWDWTMGSGRTLWEELVRHYTRGADQARSFAERWASLAGSVDAERHRAVLARLRRPAVDAAQWRDKCLRYFQAFSQRPLAPPSPASQ
jgi:alpha-glucuronidase